MAISSKFWQGFSAGLIVMFLAVCVVVWRIDV